MYRDEWARGAANAYRRLDDNVKQRVDDALNELREDPFRASNVKALSGPLRGTYRKRIGDLRLLFSLDTVEQVLYVEAIVDRKDAYR